MLNLWQIVKAQASSSRALLFGVALVLALVLGASIFYNIKTSLDRAAERKSLNKALDILDARIIQEKTINLKRLDSINQRIKEKELVYSKLQEDHVQLEQILTKLNRRSYENKSRINAITNSDSLAELIAKRYR
jgi:uncharacterized protein HemX